MSRIYDHYHGLARYERIWFDLDGTLYNSEQFYTGVFKEMAGWLEHHGMTRAGTAFVDCAMGLKQARGNDYPCLLDDALKLLDVDPRVKEALLEIYQNHDCRGLSMDKPDLEALAALRAGGCWMGIVTNGRQSLQERKIRQLKLNRYMDRVIVLDPGKGMVLKPGIQGFLSLCRGEEVRKAVMVGDRFDVDAAFAGSLGMDFIGVGHYGD